jgi:hypothetical protein
LTQCDVETAISETESETETAIHVETAISEFAVV